MRLLHEIAILQTVKSKVIMSLFEAVRLSVSISLRNLYNSLNSIKEIEFYTQDTKTLPPKSKCISDIYSELSMNFIESMFWIQQTRPQTMLYFDGTLKQDLSGTRAY